MVSVINVDTFDNRARPRSVAVRGRSQSSWSKMSQVTAPIDKIAAAPSRHSPIVSANNQMVLVANPTVPLANAPTSTRRTLRRPLGQSNGPALESCRGQPLSMSGYQFWLIDHFGDPFSEFSAKCFRKDSAVDTLAELNNSRERIWVADQYRRAFGEAPSETSGATVS
jgi:hypothetical protein